MVYTFLFNNLSKNEKQFSNLCIVHVLSETLIFYVKETKIK